MLAEAMKRRPRIKYGAWGYSSTKFLPAMKGSKFRPLLVMGPERLARDSADGAVRLTGLSGEYQERCYKGRRHG